MWNFTGMIVCVLFWIAINWHVLNASNNTYSMKVELFIHTGTHTPSNGKTGNLMQVIHNTDNTLILCHFWNDHSR